MTDLTRLCRELSASRQVGSAVAVAAARWSNGRWYEKVEAAGFTSHFGAARPVDRHTLFDLASLTKPVTALAVARLVRQGRLDLHAPLGEHLSEARGTASNTASLDLVLAHRAGLAGHAPLFRSLAAGQLVSRSAMLHAAAQCRAAHAVGADPRAGFSPEYSDLGYLLAGEVAARVVGRSLDEVMTELVIQPLRADSGSGRQWRTRDADAAAKTAATEYVPWRGGLLRGIVHDENAWAFSGDATSGHAGLFGTASGVLRLGEAVVDVLAGRRPEFLTRENISPLVRPRPGGTLRAGFDGKSDVGSSSGARFGPNAVGHLGFTGTSLWCDPDAQMVGVLLTNRVHPARDAVAIRRIRPIVYDAIAAWAGAQAAVSVSG